MRNKPKSIKGKIFVMNDITVEKAAYMARHLVNNEHKGWGDTTEAALHRLSIKYGVKPSVVTRLLYRKVDDMLLSNFVAIASAYQAACIKTERLIEHERATHETNPIALKAADFVVRTEKEEG